MAGSFACAAWVWNHDDGGGDLAGAPVGDHVPTVGGEDEVGTYGSCGDGGFAFGGAADELAELEDGCASSTGTNVIV